MNFRIRNGELVFLGTDNLKDYFIFYFDSEYNNCKKTAHIISKNEKIDIDLTKNYIEIPNSMKSNSLFYISVSMDDLETNKVRAEK